MCKADKASEAEVSTYSQSVLTVSINDVFLVNVSSSVSNSVVINLG